MLKNEEITVLTKLLNIVPMLNGEQKQYLLGYADGIASVKKEQKESKESGKKEVVMNGV